MEGYTECVRLLKNEVSIHDKDGIGFTALHHAAANGRTECVRVLINEQSSDVDVQTDNGGTTPLNFATGWARNKECIKILLEHGTNTKVSDIHGKTALHRALNNDLKQPDPQVVKWLFQGTENPPTLRQL